MLLRFSEPVAKKSLNYQWRIPRPRQLDEDDQGLHHYPFMVSLERCNGSFDSLFFIHLDKYFFPNETKDINVNVFDMTTRIEDKNH